MDDLNEIRKLVKEKKLVIGMERTMKSLRTGSLVRVYVSGNCSPVEKSDIQHYATLANVPVVDLTLDNDELGDVCKRTHKIMVLGVQK